MWSIAVVLPTLQADFGVTRADVSLAYWHVGVRQEELDGRGGDTIRRWFAMFRAPIRRANSNRLARSLRVSHRPHKAETAPDSRANRPPIGLLVSGGTEGSWTPRWRKADSNRWSHLRLKAGAMPR
jgi:hypothetical protein